MAGLSAAADHGSGHLLGVVLGDGQAVSRAHYHVCILSVYAKNCCFFPSQSISALTCPVLSGRQNSSQSLWHLIVL